MNVKAVVKVMNFHSLLRVEASRRQAEKYAEIEKSLMNMMEMILHNKNLQLDRKIKEPSKDAPALKIYMGSDFGFCGSINTSVSSVISEDKTEAEKIVIGRKLRAKQNEHTLHLTVEDVQNNFDVIKDYITKAVKEGSWSSIELVYNKYINSATVKLVKEQIYPLEIKTDAAREWDDFILEGDADNMLEDMLILCIVYKLKIATVSSYASENILRQNSTTESLKKIDEIEEEEVKARNKERTQQSVTKTVDNYTKQKALSIN